MEKREILIIGAGPAGLAASIEAAQTGAQVLLIDENDTPGGQLFKQIHKFFGSSKLRPEREVLISENRCWSRQKRWAWSCG